MLQVAKHIKLMVIIPTVIDCLMSTGPSFPSEGYPDLVFRERLQGATCACEIFGLGTNSLVLHVPVSSYTVYYVGEFGIVYKAHWVKIGQINPQIVAVKTLKG